MNIIINGESRNISESLSMLDFLNLIGLENRQAIAVAVNGEVLQKGKN